MLNFLLATDQDRKEAAAIERRRAREEERKQRIFNPRVRLIGNDYPALVEQIEQKKKQVAEEKRINDIFERERLKNDEVALALAQKELEERKKLQQEINEFRKNFQKPEDRREFDLNDPNYIKKSLPPRIRDDDPRLGPSSAQKFEGEDLASDERAKIQREQMRSWLSQQIEERKAAEKERQMAEDAYKAAVIARDNRAIELDHMEKECRKRLEIACVRFNKALTEERECYKQIKEQQEKEDNMAEIYNTMTSDMMTENPEVSKSSLGSSRQIGYLYKGMTPEEKEIFRAAQLAQIEEQKKKRDLERQAERQFDDYFNGTQRTICLMDLELQRKKKEEQRQLAEENKRMGIEQRNHQEYLEKIVYRNKPTAAFFDCFNKSTR